MILTIFSCAYLPDMYIVNVCSTVVNILYCAVGFVHWVQGYFSIQVIQQISDLQTFFSFHRLSFHLYNRLSKSKFLKSFIESNKSEFSFMDHALISKNPLMNISTQVSSMFSSKRFIILHVIFLSMIYFKIVFVLHVKYETNSPLEKLIYFLIEVILVCNISVLYVQLCISTVYPSVCSPTKI